MKAVVVGSRALELNGDVVQIILDELVDLGSRGFDEIMLRKPMRRSLRPFEALVASLCGVMGFRVSTYAPEPGGRAQVFFRNIAMVAESNEVVAFFPEDAEMTGGTGHVVEKALDQHKPVRAYSIVDGKSVLIGSDNEDIQS